jgi:hypothetical protein
METILNLLRNAVDELLGRASGPLHFRLVLQPVVASILAIRAGLKDARQGRPAFFWTLLTKRHERRQLLHSGWNDVSKIFIVACVLDAIYQFIELRSFKVLQLLIVAVALAVVPYVVIRGPVNRLIRALHNPAKVSSQPTDTL